MEGNSLLSMYHNNSLILKLNGLVILSSGVSKFLLSALFDISPFSVYLVNAFSEVSPSSDLTLSSSLIPLSFSSSSSFILVILLTPLNGFDVLMNGEDILCFPSFINFKLNVLSFHFFIEIKIYL